MQEFSFFPVNVLVYPDSLTLCRLMNDSEWCILSLKVHGTQKASLKALLTVKDEFYRETDFFCSVPEEKLQWKRS